MTAIRELLLAHGADALGHTGGRTLLDHLVGTAAIVRRWGAPTDVERAALVHSVYGTDAYGHRLMPLSARTDVADAAGAKAERLAYLFCMTPRGPLLAGTRHWAPDLPLRAVDDADPVDPPTPPEIDALILLHMANLADQAQAPDGTPGRWLVRLAALADLLGERSELAAPSFARRLEPFTAADERLAIRAYRDGVSRADDPAGRVSRLGLAAATCPVIAEPCVWLAYVAAAQGDGVVSRTWTAEARSRLVALGTAWDKRLTYEEWHELIDALDERSESPLPATTVGHPRVLHQAVVNGSAGTSPATAATPDVSAGRRRFQGYVEALAGVGGPGAPGEYPGLTARPWHDPAAFPLVTQLESNFAAIRDELLRLDPAQFQRESERIVRTGDWDVLFLYERGRRHDDTCAACPVTVRAIETSSTMRSAAGLIYVSRMRSGAHIAPHRGPTNLRLRCHLALEVPDGDCAIRVGTETRRWETGRCLVFDDFFEHEAWNHTDSDRIVLIVDLWHPDLSATEVTMLEGLHTYTETYARRLSRYWATNAATATERRSVPS